MSLTSKNNITKKDMNKQIYYISNFLATKLVSNLRLFCILIFILLHVTHETYSAPFYVLFFLAIFPIILPTVFPNIMKQKKGDKTKILPLLSKKYNYTSSKAAVRSFSFLVETIILFAWQIGITPQAYQNKYSLYFPIILLLGGTGIWILSTFNYYFKLRSELLNNTL